MRLLTDRRAGAAARAAGAAVVACLAGAALALAPAPAPAVALAVAPPRLAVAGASLTVAGTGERLYGDNAGREMLIASTTKLMTALVVVDHVHRLSTVFAQTDYVPAADDSQIGLVPGERMSVHDLLLALMLPSADDAAIDLAYNVGGHSIGRFVAMMNAEARALGLTHTHYANPVGFDSPQNYSTPYELTRLAAYDMAHSAFLRRIVRLRSATLETGNEVRYVTNTDTLLGAVPWIDGVKTGHTRAAGYILVSSGTRDGLTLIGSVLGTASEAARNANALALLTWGFAEFAQVRPVTRGAVLAHVPVTGEATQAPVVAAAGYTTVVPRADRVATRLGLPRALTGPLARGARVGEVTVVIGGREVARIPLVLARAVPGLPVTRRAHFPPGLSTLMSLALTVGAAVTVRTMRGSRPQVVRSGRLERG